ncbi:MAG: 2'-5' RNA ligase family protein [Candidatus Pacebacteria bacterium]|nr:2'-5' RNA ligase family protein [Candidatus Paceibacterota bacterium]
MEKNVGYVAIEFDDVSKREVANWASQISEGDLVTTAIDGKIEGGNVTDKLHLTLFYGLDENAINQGELSDFISMLPKPAVHVTGVSAFLQDAFACKTLYLEVTDDLGELQSIHERLKDFSHFSKYQEHNYKPHITIAYVITEFDVNSLTNDFPKNLFVKAVTHFKKL